MREFEYNFSEGFKVGLRKHHKNPKNLEALVEALNVRVTEYGLEAYTDIEDPFSPQYGTSWPFPQLVSGADFTFLITKSGSTITFYRILSVEFDETSQTYLVEAQRLYGTTDSRNLGSGRFQVADFGKWFYLTNGVIALKYDVEMDTFIVASTTDPTIPRMRHVCAFNGQMVGGCFTSSDGYNGLGEDGIAWSDIGSATFLPPSALQEQTSYLKNTSGFTRLSKGGVVKGVHKLGKQVVVYTDKQIGSLVPITSPVPAFSIGEILPIGVISAGAIGVNDSEHVFIDSHGWLWKLTAGSEIKKLGYREFMTKLNPANIVITYNPIQGDFHISDGDICYLLTGTGLTEVHQNITSIGFVDGNLLCVSKSNGKREGVIVTDTIDFGFRALKTISVMECGIDGTIAGLAGSSPYYGAIQWKATYDTDFAQTPEIPVNQEGVVTQILSGLEFRFRMKCKDYRYMNPDYFKIRWKMSDMRAIRGTYGMPKMGKELV